MENTNIDNKSSVLVNQSVFWEQFMTRMRQIDITIWSFLQQGKLVSCIDNNFHWMPNRKEGEMAFISVLNMPNRNKIICDCLQNLTGYNCTFKAITTDCMENTAEEDDDEYLNLIYETFGRDPVPIEGNNE